MDVLNTRENDARMPQATFAPGAAIFPEETWIEIGRNLKLSGRELQIVRAVFDGLTDLTMACKLGIAPRTVHTYVERLHRKLGLTNRVELVLRVTNEFLRLTASPGSNLPSICAKRTAGRCPFGA